MCMFGITEPDLPLSGSHASNLLTKYVSPPPSTYRPNHTKRIPSPLTARRRLPRPLPHPLPSSLRWRHPRNMEGDGEVEEGGVGEEYWGVQVRAACISSLSAGWEADCAVISCDDDSFQVNDLKVLLKHADIKPVCNQSTQPSLPLQSIPPLILTPRHSPLPPLRLPLHPPAPRVPRRPRYRHRGLLWPLPAHKPAGRTVGQAVAGDQ